MQHELEVWLFTAHVGTLIFIKGQLHFRYTPHWLSQPNAVALSISLPLRTEPFNDHEARPYFAGLLPEGHLRQLLAQQFHISKENDFALLDRIGGECAGAVTFLKPGQMLSAEINDVDWMNEKKIIEYLDELPTRPLLAGKKGLRLSLAGAQDKLLVVVDGARIGLPRNGTPSTHILKPPISGLEDSVINEHFCLTLAHELQLMPAKSTIHTVLDRSFLLVERYDRIKNPQEKLHRVHQEDFCQAMGILPEMKYQTDGGPNLPQCFELLRRVTRPNAPQILRLFDYVIFNTLIGNNDAHGKNFSLLYTEKTPVLAPLYDVLSTAVYENLAANMAMKISNKTLFKEVLVQHWGQLAESIELTKGQAKRRILELTDSLPSLARKLQSDPRHDFTGNKLVERIITLIEERCEITTKRLNNTDST